MSLNKYNEEDKIYKLCHAIKAGLTLALISDAGTPCISDPGFNLVAECYKEGIVVESFSTQMGEY